VAEALECAPEKIPTLIADLRPGAAWRSGFGIAEPSPRLVEAIESLSEVLTEAGRADGAPTFDVVLATVREDPAGQHPIDETVRAALRSALEQLRSRQGAVPVG
jgi:hypothetical protein